MTTTLATIRAALADACETLGLHASGYITDDITTPAAVVARTVVTYDSTMGRGSDELTFRVSVYVDRTDEIGAQQFLDELVEPGTSQTLKTILEDADTATAAGVHYIRVRTASEVNQGSIGSLNYLSVDFDLEVMV